MPLRLPNNPAQEPATLAVSRGVHRPATSSLITRDRVSARSHFSGFEFQRHADVTRQLQAGRWVMLPARFIPSLLTEAAAHAVASLFGLTTNSLSKFLFRLVPSADTQNGAACL